MWWLLPGALAAEVVGTVGVNLGAASGVGLSFGVRINERVHLELITNPPMPAPPPWMTLGLRASVLGGQPVDPWRPMVTCGAAYNGLINRYDSLGVGCGVGVDLSGLRVDVGPTLLTRPGWYAETRSAPRLLVLPQVSLTTPW